MSEQNNPDDFFHAGGNLQKITHEAAEIYIKLRRAVVSELNAARRTGRLPDAKDVLYENYSRFLIRFSNRIFEDEKESRGFLSWVAASVLDALDGDIHHESDREDDDEIIDNDGGSDSSTPD